MKLINSISDIDAKKEIILTIGNFDGVHLGHFDLFEQAKNYAKKFNAQIAAMTFVPHPMTILRNSDEKFLLTSLEKKRDLLNLAGVDYLIEINFNRDVSTLSPLDFLKRYVLISPSLKAMLLGFNFSFGAKKSGTHQVVQEILKSHAPKVELKIAEPFLMENEPVSSSKIRLALDNGDVTLAAKLIGRPHAINGVVVRGDGRGRTIGFPTANIIVPLGYFYPRPGVYVTKTNYKGMAFNSITNIGVRPTFTDHSELKFETHILDFHQMIYGEEIEVEFHSQIRSEKKFQSINELVEQIKLDQQFAIGYWKDKTS